MTQGGHEQQRPYKKVDVRSVINTALGASTNPLIEAMKTAEPLTPLEIFSGVSALHEAADLAFRPYETFAVQENGSLTRAVNASVADLDALLHNTQPQDFNQDNYALLHQAIDQSHGTTDQLAIARGQIAIAILARNIQMIQLGALEIIIKLVNLLLEMQIS